MVCPCLSKSKRSPAALNGKDIQVEELVKLAPDVVIVSSKNYQEELIKNGFSAVNMIYRDYPDMEKSIYATAEVIGTDKARALADKLTKSIHENTKFVETKNKKISQLTSVQRYFTFLVEQIY